MATPYLPEPGKSTEKPPRHQRRYASRDAEVQRRRALKKAYGSASRHDLRRLAFRKIESSRLHLAGLSDREIRDRLGYASHTTVRYHYQRATDELRAALKRVEALADGIMPIGWVWTLPQHLKPVEYLVADRWSMPIGLPEEGITKGGLTPRPPPGELPF